MSHQKAVAQNVKDAVKQFLDLSSESKNYKLKSELMKFINYQLSIINTNSKNDELQFISKHYNFIHYLQYEVIYWSKPEAKTSVTGKKIDETKCGTIQKLIAETIRLFGSLVRFMQNTPWHYDDNVYKIYKMFIKLMDYYTTESQQICTQYNKRNIMLLNDSIICDVIKTINNSIYDIYTNGTQSLYDFSWFRKSIGDLTWECFNDAYAICKKSNKFRHITASVLLKIIQFKNVKNIEFFSDYICYFSDFLTNKKNDSDLLSISLQIFQGFAETLTEKEYNKLPLYNKYVQTKIKDISEIIIKNSKNYYIPNIFSVRNVLPHLFRIPSLKQSLQHFVSYKIDLSPKPITISTCVSLKTCILGYCRKTSATEIPLQMCKIIRSFYSITNPYGNDYELWKQWITKLNENKIVAKSEGWGEDILKPIFIKGNIFDSEQSIVLSTKYFFDSLYESNEFDPHCDLSGIDKWNENEINKMKLKAINEMNKHREILSMKNMKDDSGMRGTETAFQNIFGFMNKHLSQMSKFKIYLGGLIWTPTKWVCFFVGLSKNGNVIGASYYMDT
eukprot:247477_1